MRCILRKSALIVVVCCKIHNFIIDQRMAREGDEIDHGAGLTAVSNPLNGVGGNPDDFAQDILHCEPDIARHVRQGDGSAREEIADFLEWQGFIRPARARR
jgi:hypothetical protein